MKPIRGHCEYCPSDPSITCSVCGNVEFTPEPTIHQLKQQIVKASDVIKAMLEPGCDCDACMLAQDYLDEYEKDEWGLVCD